MTKKITLTIMALTIAALMQAINIPKGTYRFHNQPTGWKQVKFLYGNSSENTTHVISMSFEDDNKWIMTINGTISNQTHYFFSNTSLPDGEYPQSVTTVKDMIAGYRGEQRTQTFKDADNIQMIPGATFIPNSSDQYTSGYWLLDNPSDAVSSTLPVLYINTEGEHLLHLKRHTSTLPITYMPTHDGM